MKKLTILSLACALLINTIDVQFNASEVESPNESKVVETTEVVYAPTNPTAAQVEAAAATDLVVFEDSNLEAEVASELGVAVGDITVGDMEKLDNFGVSNDVTSLTGLEYAINLTYLQLGNNQISDISPLAGLTNLTTLILTQNQISDISPLVGLTNLTYLRMDLNQISDMSAVADLTNLTYLDLSENQISDMSAVAGLTNLTYLDLSKNQISDMSAVAGLTNLTTLILTQNQISDISAVASLTNLTYLYLGENQISDISPVTGLINLETLYLVRNQISDISPVAGLTNLTFLSLSYNQISDISPVAGLTNLDDLGIYDNQVSDISPLAGLTNLTFLSASYNQISDISPLAGLTNLDSLYLSNQSISLDDLFVSTNDEIFFIVTGIDDTEYPVSLGIPSIGTQDVSGTWSIPTSIGLVTDTSFDGTVSQTVTYTEPAFTGVDSASVTEETALSDEELISLFEVVSKADEVITVNQSAVDYSTPGEYQVVFTDESGNEFICTLTVEDKLPTLEINKSKVSISVGSSIEDVLDQLEYSATEITTGDLNSVISIDDSAVDYSTSGNYEIIFTVEDEEGNTVTKKVTVTILEDAIVDTENSENNGNAASNSERKNSNSESVKSEQSESNEDNKLATTGSESIVLFLISSLAIFIALKFNLKKLN